VPAMAAGRLAARRKAVKRARAIIVRKWKQKLVRCDRADTRGVAIYQGSLDGGEDRSAWWKSGKG
jgi:hypothetical protein